MLKKEEERVNIAHELDATKWWSSEVFLSWKLPQESSLHVSSCVLFLVSFSCYAALQWTKNNTSFVHLSQNIYKYYLKTYCFALKIYFFNFFSPKITLLVYYYSFDFVFLINFLSIFFSCFLCKNWNNLKFIIILILCTIWNNTLFYS